MSSIEQLQELGTFETFLMAVVLAGVIQIGLSLCRMGFIATYFPTSVIKGLLFAIGVILVLKQIPHILGHDEDPIGNKSFLQADDQNTFSELLHTIASIHPGAAFIGILSILAMVFWDKIPYIKKLQIPAPVAVIGFSVLANSFIPLEAFHLVQVPIADTLKDTFGFLIFPDFSALFVSQVYIAAGTIALVASLETLLNLEAVDKLDPLDRKSSPNRELLAQGVGNIVGGFIGAIPVTSVIVRSSVNINAGVKTKLSTIFHGFLIFGSVLLIPDWLNKIPLSALAAILLVTGLKLASLKTIKQMWAEGRYQFLPFSLTVLAIVFTDLLVGVLIGLGVSICFILLSQINRPLKKTVEKHASGDEVLHIELANQVSFFNRASLNSTLENIPRGKHVLIDATNTDYIDPDILDLLQEYQSQKTQKIRLSLKGFKDKYPQLKDHIEYQDCPDRESQSYLTPELVMEAFKEGNLRFREGTHLTRDISRQLNATAVGQYPMAVVLSCIDSRSPVELIFDLSIGDIFSIRVAGNIISPEILGSMEYSCAVAGAKLVLVMGHTSCGAVKASADLLSKHQTATEATGCVNLDILLNEIQRSIPGGNCDSFINFTDVQKEDYCNDLAYKNVLRTIGDIRQNSSTLDNLLTKGEIAIVGSIYNIKTGEVAFFQSPDSNPHICNVKKGLLSKMLKATKAVVRQ